MAKYFNQFPKTVYATEKTPVGVDSVTNIISRFSFQNELKENIASFYKYQIKDSDTPEIIAHKYYGDSERHWIVLMFNDIVDPQFDWPMPYNTLINYIDQKYTANGSANTTPQTGLAWAMSQNNVQAYYKTITRTAPDSTQNIEVLTIDANTYSNLASSSSNTYTLADGNVITETITKSKKTYYDYEMETNEAKRDIKLLKSDFAYDVEKEFKRVINGK